MFTDDFANDLAAACKRVAAAGPGRRYAVIDAEARRIHDRHRDILWKPMDQYILTPAGRAICVELGHESRLNTARAEDITESALWRARWEEEEQTHAH